MKIVIIGAGEVGYNLAIRFAKEDYDLTVIDNNPEKCKFVKT
ncbi:MAG: NAD(P)-binding domain-containing protein, partial [FCB group bacterium]|nr:NAD(P)-binding domain-containing protein [FCB group bacterium]